MVKEPVEPEKGDRIVIHTLSIPDFSYVDWGIAFKTGKNGEIQTGGCIGFFYNEKIRRPGYLSVIVEQPFSNPFYHTGEECYEKDITVRIFP